MPDCYWTSNSMFDTPSPKKKPLGLIGCKMTGLHEFVSKKIIRETQMYKLFIRLND